MERIATGSIEMTWDTAVRIAELRFESETHATGPQGHVLVDALSRWIGTGKTQFALLGDGRNLGAVDAEYRAVWGDFLRRHRDECYVAFFNMGIVIRIAAEMFRLGTGVRLRAFAREEDARAWLREMGMAA